jgi:hypothetical protein
VHLCGVWPEESRRPSLGRGLGTSLVCIVERDKPRPTFGLGKGTQDVTRPGWSDSQCHTTRHVIKRVGLSTTKCERCTETHLHAGCAENTHSRAHSWMLLETWVWHALSAWDAHSEKSWTLPEGDQAYTRACTAANCRPPPPGTATSPGRSPRYPCASLGQPGKPGPYPWGDHWDLVFPRRKHTQPSNPTRHVTGTRRVTSPRLVT